MKVLNLGLRGVLLGVLLGGAVTAAHAQPQKKQVEIKAQGQADIGAPETKSGLSAKEKGPKYNREQDLRAGKSGDAVSEAQFKEQLRNMYDMLTQNVAYMWKRRYRSEYVRLAEHKVVAALDGQIDGGVGDGG
jgi:hypothetical protein